MSNEEPRPEEVEYALRLMFDQSPRNSSWEPAFHRLSDVLEAALRGAPIAHTDSGPIVKAEAMSWFIEEHRGRLDEFERALVERMMAEVSL